MLINLDFTYRTIFILKHFLALMTHYHMFTVKNYCISAISIANYTQHVVS